MIIYSFDEDSGNVLFSNDEMGILSVNLNNINLDDDNFYEDDPKSIIHVRLLPWYNKFKQCKAFIKEINEELMLVACHPTRWWYWYMTEDKKKKLFFIAKK